MDSRSILLFTALVAFSCVVLPGATALKCYQCTSKQDASCADPMPKDTMPRECTHTGVRDLTRLVNDLSTQFESVVRDVFGTGYNTAAADTAMQCQKLDILLDNRHNFTIRGCALVVENAEEHCRRIVAGNSNAVRVTYCGTCTADGCNAAPSLVSSLLLTVALPIALLAFLSSPASPSPLPTLTTM